MSFWKGVKNVALNIVTLGGHSKLQNLIDEYNNLLIKYNTLVNKLENLRSSTHSILQNIIEQKRKSLYLLKKIQKQFKLKCIFSSQDKIIMKNYDNHSDFTGIKNSSAILGNTIAGLSAGLASGFGTWSLVSTFANASTGTAIGSLSGVAATNATLAWLGGGSLATGGGGMAAGAVMLGKIIFWPAAIVFSVLTYKKTNKQIQEVEAELAKLNKDMTLLENAINEIENLKIKSLEYSAQLSNLYEKLLLEFERLRKILFPNILSHLLRRFRSIFGLGYFTSNELMDINRIYSDSNVFCVLLDKKLLLIKEDNN